MIGAGATIVIPALSSHLEILRSSVPRIQKLFGQFPMLVTPEPSLLAGITGQELRIAADSDYVTLSKPEVRNRLPEPKKWLAGWYYQQILKYDIVLKSRASQILILDADTVLLTGVPAPQGTNALYPRSTENHAPYAYTFEALTGLPRCLRYSAIVNVMWFSRQHLASLLAHIETHTGVNWRQAILETSASLSEDCCYSEYETYANWCAQRFRQYAQKPFRLFRRADLLLSPSRGVESVVRMAERRRYDAVAFEGRLHKTTAMRRIVAQVLFRAGLCINARRYC